MSNDFAMAEKQEIKAGGSILASAMWKNWVLSYRVFRGSKLKSLTYDAVGSGDGLKGFVLPFVFFSLFSNFSDLFL